MRTSSLIMHPTDLCVFCHFINGSSQYTVLDQDEKQRIPWGRIPRQQGAIHRNP